MGNPTWNTKTKKHLWLQSCFSESHSTPKTHYPPPPHFPAPQEISFAPCFQEGWHSTLVSGLGIVFWNYTTFLELTTCSAEVGSFLQLPPAETLGFRPFTCLDLSQVTLFFSGIRIVTVWWFVAFIFFSLTLLWALKMPPFCLLHFTAAGYMYIYASM